MLNLIEAKLLQTEYVKEPHLAITIDGKPLDLIVSDLNGDHSYLGLVPTLLPWLADPVELDLVWKRAEPIKLGRYAVPILMCPDDLCLWCTVIVADCVFASNVVTWERLGVDAGDGDNMPESIGSTVNWFPNLGPFQFERANYNACLEKFKNDLEPNRS